MKVPPAQPKSLLLRYAMISSELCPVLVQRHGLMARAPLEKATRGWSLSGLAARFLRYTRV